MTRLSIVMLCGLLAGCPDSKTPDATAGSGVAPQPITTEAPSVTPTADPVPDPPSQTAIAGGWTVAVTSESPGINPDMFDTPEKKAKVFYAHHAKAADGKVTVEHQILGKTSDVDAEAAAALDTHMNGADWESVMAAAQKDAPSEGGTVFKFAITVGKASWEITTSHLERHPDLMKVVDAVKAATGKP
jgi:hypothetical protein